MTGARPQAGLDLALETSTRAVSASVGRGQRVWTGCVRRGGGHARDLAPLVEGLVKGSGGEPADLGRAFVGTGPGSYTGLRVGTALALGLAIADGPALFGIPSWEALAASVLAARPDLEGLDWLLDARSGAVYHGRVGACPGAPGGLAVELAVTAVAVETLAARLDGARALVTDAATRATLARHDELSALLSGDVTVATPGARDVLDLGRARAAAGTTPTPAFALEPLYLRPFAARKRAR